MPSIISGMIQGNLSATSLGLFIHWQIGKINLYVLCHCPYLLCCQIVHWYKEIYYSALAHVCTLSFSVRELRLMIKQSARLIYCFVHRLVYTLVHTLV